MGPNEPVGEKRVGDLWFDTQVAEMRIWHIPNTKTDEDGNILPNRNDPVWVPVTGTGYTARPVDVQLSIDEDGTYVTPDGRRLIDSSDMERMQAQLDTLIARMTSLETDHK